MDVTFEPEQLALRESVARLLAGRAGTDIEAWRETWSALAELGVLAMALPERVGGADAGAIEVMIVAQEIGRAGLRQPFVEAVVVAGQLLAELPDQATVTAVLDGIADGSRLAVLAHDEPRSRWSTSAWGVTASETEDGWRLTGTKEPVLYGADADTLLVSAVAADGTRLFLVDAGQDGVSTHAGTSFDDTPVARIELADARAVPLADAELTHTLLMAASVRALTAYGAEALGAMEAAVAMTVSYLGTRKQFGVPLKAFQALTHRAADLYVAQELARSLTLHASLALAEGVLDPDIASRLAVQLSESGRLIGRDAIQLHGGVGMTAELAVGHYTARLEAIERLWGDGRFHLGRLADTLLDHESLEFLKG
ncbi:acyl-CoA dehydrogenase family protein [Nocardioides sp.]|uniref:acyl-CoA dehydrogenase family protein n=1 Tax=Nocardioides sp. TaxID=35761 RepID=UPI0039E2506A